MSFFNFFSIFLGCMTLNIKCLYMTMALKVHWSQYNAILLLKIDDLFVAVDMITVYFAFISNCAGTLWNATYYWQYQVAGNFRWWGQRRWPRIERQPCTYKSMPGKSMILTGHWSCFCGYNNWLLSPPTRLAHHPLSTFQIIGILLYIAAGQCLVSTYLVVCAAWYLAICYHMSARPR